MKVDAIILSDIHLTLDRPKCRLDDWEIFMIKTFQYIEGLRLTYNCPIICAGDLFDKHKPSPELLAFAFMYLPDDMWVVPGNHDLEAHNIKFLKKSGLYPLYVAEKIKIINSGHWGDTDPQPILKLGGREFIVWHVFTYKGELPWKDCKAPDCKKVMSGLKCETIFTGDNHKTFMYKRGNQLIFNAGSLFQMKADQIDHKPVVGLWNAKSNTVTLHEIPRAPQGMISRAHLEIKQQKENRYGAFISNVKDYGVSIKGFEHNMDKFLISNTVSEKVKNVISKVMEELNEY